MIDRFRIKYDTQVYQTSGSKWITLVIIELIDLLGRVTPGFSKRIVDRFEFLGPLKDFKITK